MGRLKDQVANSLAETAEEMNHGSGASTLRWADMYLGDIEKFCAKTFTDQHLELSLPVYVVEEKTPGGGVVTLNKKREGVFVLGQGRIILSRDLSFARTQTADYAIASAAVEALELIVEGEKRPGFRLKVTGKVPSYALGLAPVDMENETVVRALRDRVISAIAGRL